MPSASVTCPGPTSVTAVPRCIRTPLRAEDLGDVVVGAVGERREQRVAEVDEVDLRRRDRQVAVLDGHRLGDQVGERAGELDAGGAAADDDEVQRALVEQRRVAVGVLEDAR